MINAVISYLKIKRSNKQGGQPVFNNTEQKTVNRQTAQALQGKNFTCRKRATNKRLVAPFWYLEGPQGK